MKATKIYYEELRTFGQYNNRKVGIELEVQDGEKAIDAVQKAKLFVQGCLSSNEVPAHFLEEMVRSVKSAHHMLDQFSKKAQETLSLDDKIPF